MLPRLQQSLMRCSPNGGKWFTGLLEEREWGEGMVGFCGGIDILPMMTIRHAQDARATYFNGERTDTPSGVTGVPPGAWCGVPDARHQQ